MYKRVLLVFVLVFTMISSASAITEGKDYYVIENSELHNSDGKVKVVEIFWYGCHICYDFLPFEERWHSKHSDDDSIEFERMPAVYYSEWMPVYGDTWSHARAYYTFQKMDVEEKVHRKLFDAIHGEKKEVASKDELADFVAAAGVDKNKFVSIYASDEMENKSQKAKDFRLNHNIDRTPSVLVDGKYLSTMTLADNDGAKLVRILDSLIKKAKEERAAKKSL